MYMWFVTVSSVGRKILLRKQEVSYIAPDVSLINEHDK